MSSKVQKICRTISWNCPSTTHATSTTVAQVADKIEDADVDEDAVDADIAEADRVDHGTDDADDVVERERARLMI